jgi:sensor histidine kinase YesM
MIGQLNTVYVSNVSLNDMSKTLEQVHLKMYEYLNTRSSDALEGYYRALQQYKSQMEKLNKVPTDHEMKQMEKTIYGLSVSYVEIAENTIQAKRGRNIERYSDYYETSVDIYDYLNTYIYSLNNEQFRANSDNFQVLVNSLHYLELTTTFTLITITIFNIVFLIGLTGSMTKPLVKLAKTANRIAEGQFDVPVIETDSKDEIGVVALAFNRMIASIRQYIISSREQMENEIRMKETEMMMESHLKDVQLKYLQSQINPHFLFNTLNAGAQLAMMEGAEKTCLFVENMADFFRYNVKKINEDATLSEEIKLVDNYIYIMNVRFSGEIHYSKEIDKKLLDIRVPSMILQPIIENAVNYGIRGIEWEGHIKLSIHRDHKDVLITITDNGRGMSDEVKERVLSQQSTEKKSSVDSSGIGLTNVVSRLQLYYSREDVIDISSEGENKGTCVCIKIPNPKEGNEDD